MKNYSEMDFRERLDARRAMKEVGLSPDDVEIVGLHEDGTVEARSEAGYTYWIDFYGNVETNAPWQCFVG